VKRQKNDAADAEAICEAAQRPTMRFVQPKSAEAQAAAVIFRTRDMLVRHRTQLINALRGHLAEFGHIARKGPGHVAGLIALVRDPEADLPEAARSSLSRRWRLCRRGSRCSTARSWQGSRQALWRDG
jgi:transposase